MKCIILVATIACVLSGALAYNSHKVQKAHSDVMSYVAENMGGVRMMRSNRLHLECYNGFLPVINSYAIQAKTDSDSCASDASSKKDQELSGLDRTEIAAEVKKITDSLEDCSEKQGLDYFVCLAQNADVNKQIMETIKTKSQEIVAQNQNKVTVIETEEDTCIMDAVEKAKTKSSAAFDKLKVCIKNGTPGFEAESDDNEGSN